LENIILTMNNMIETTGFYLEEREDKTKIAAEDIAA
jgi:hypothetical protein